MFNEIKWTKTTEVYLDKYKSMMELFFDFIETGMIKTRIMFTKNSNKPINLTQYHHDNKYFILYYQFIKLAFGLIYATDESTPFKIRLYLDTLPDKKEKVEKFREFIESLNNVEEYRGKGILFQKEQIAQVKSHKHVILQCLDIVLGSIAFRLNDKHKDIPKGSSRRGKKTIAKEKLYKYINERIRKIYPSFNVGMNTGKKQGMESIWLDSYRHWSFTSKEFNYDESLNKSKKKAPS